MNKISKQFFIGIDLAWSDNNPSGVALLENNKVLFCDTMTGVDSIAKFINNYPDAIVGIDAPLLIENETGNRDIEKAFLQDFAKHKLGVYPVNKKLLTFNGKITSLELVDKIPQNLGINLFEVYPHATILQCFHKSVLPYKRKKGRDTNFIRTQLQLLQNYLNEVLKNSLKDDISNLKGSKLKQHEDKLDALVCAYTLYYCFQNNCKKYGDIFLVPNIF